MEMSPFSHFDEVQLLPTHEARSRGPFLVLPVAPSSVELGKENVISKPRRLPKD